MRPLLADAVPFRARRSMAGAATHDALYFLGGVGANTGTESILDVADDLWRFDLEPLAWHALDRLAPWPPPRRCPGWAPLGDALHLWGGSGVADGAHTFLADHWCFAPATGWNRMKPALNPSPRYVPVFEPVDAVIVLFAGYTEAAGSGRMLKDTWIFADDEWHHVAADGPGARYGAMGARHDRSIVVFGGCAEHDLNDAWRFDLDDGRWTQLADGRGSSPAPRYCGAVAVEGDRLVLFGGRSRRHPKLNYNDLWTLDLSTGRWENVSPTRGPHRYDGATGFPGYHAKAASAVVDHWLYLLGGEGLIGHVSDFWRLDLRALRWEFLAAARDDDPVLW
jgi:N-acetylneuraminic acid mutarotase